VKRLIPASRTKRAVAATLGDSGLQLEKLIAAICINDLTIRFRSIRGKRSELMQAARYIISPQSSRNPYLAESKGHILN
jgi:hypothetical protein